MKSETCLHVCRGQGEAEERGSHSRLVGGSFNKQGNLLTRLVLGGHKTSRTPHLPARILQVYRETLTGFSHVHSTGKLNTFVFQDWILGAAAGSRKGKQNTESKDRGVGGEPPGARVNWQSRLFDGLLQQQVLCHRQSVRQRTETTLQLVISQFLMSASSLLGHVHGFCDDFCFSGTYCFSSIAN